MSPLTATPAASIDGIRSAIARGETTAKALTEIYQARIAGEDDKIHAYLSVDNDYALAQAARIDDLAAKGDPLPKLAGVPSASKTSSPSKASPPPPARRSSKAIARPTRPQQ